VFYFPLDFAFAIRPYLRLLHPELIVIAETEFWPNFLRLAKASGAAITIVNARISDRSWRGYHRFRFLLRQFLQNIDLFLAQTSEDARRLQDIGAPAQRIQVSGNLKFDFALASPPPIVASLRSAFLQFSAHPIIVGGSLVPKGGHNIIEPAQHGVAIIVGNHTENFRDMVELFRSRDAVRVAGPAEFPLLLMDLLSNDAERQALGQRAAETLRSQMG